MKDGKKVDGRIFIPGMKGGSNYGRKEGRWEGFMEGENKRVGWKEEKSALEEEGKREIKDEREVNGIVSRNVVTVRGREKVKDGSKGEEAIQQREGGEVKKTRREKGRTERRKGRK